VKIGKSSVPKLQEVMGTETENLAQRLFGPEHSGAIMPVPVFLPWPTYHIFLEPAKRIKQKAEKIVKTILSSS